jgi:ABC-type bacteriocin/lantibiotic exporter with double-glycine peptidase domain
MTEVSVFQLLIKELFRDLLNLDFGELKTALTEGFYVIAYIKIQIVETGFSQKHAVVVAEIGRDKILLLDPMRGELEVSEADFLREWSATRRETTVIK